MEPALGVCWPGLGAVAVAEEGLVRVFCVFEVVGFPEPFVTVEAPEFPGFPVFPPPVPWVPVVAEGAGAGAGVEFAGGFEVVVEPPPRTPPKRVSTVSPTPPRTSPSPRPLSCRTSRGAFALRSKSPYAALKERNWIAAACARGRKGVVT